MSTRGITAFALVAMLAELPMGVRSAGAEESGSFRALRSYARDYTSIEQGEARITAGTLIGTSTVLQSSGEPFVEGANQLATCLVYAKTSTAGADIESRCTATDGSGDSWFVAGKRTAGNMRDGGGGEGHFDLTGGTGKFAGVTGRCTYINTYLPETHVVSTVECNWRRP